MFWFIIFLVSLALELITTALISIWFSVGAIFALISSYLNFPILVQGIVFILVSFLSILLTKPFVEKRLLTKVEKNNIEALVGKKAVVTMEISNLLGKGEVQLEGKYWTARSKDDEIIPVGETVVIERIEGVKLIVSKLNKEKGE